MCIEESDAARRVVCVEKSGYQCVLRRVVCVKESGVC